MHPSSAGFGPLLPTVPTASALGRVPGEGEGPGTDHHLEVIRTLFKVLVSLWGPVPVFPGLSLGLGPVLAREGYISTGGGGGGGGAGTSFHRFGRDLGCSGSSQSLSSDSLCPPSFLSGSLFVCLFVFIKVELIYNVLALVFW